MGAKELGNIIYFDPNNVNIENNTGDNINLIFNGIELTKNQEDMSIAVDLEVVSKSRNNITTNDGNVKLSMISGTNRTNFLEGSKIGNTNVLTSFFSDISYSENQDSDTNKNEAMCINSIDIEFQSWYVSSVVIKFTDVRGASLFSPSEHIYQKSKNSELISDNNIFSSFFTFPYPMFKLKVKGYYGDAVTYPLHMVDFNSEFNSEKGSYEITASFIGYTYALLNDIQMPYLLSAPYTKEYGEQYWDEQVKNGRFRTFEGVQLQKIPDMLEKIKKGEFVFSDINGSNENVIALNNYEKQASNIKTIKSLIDDYISIINKNYAVTTTSNQYTLTNIKIKNGSTIKKIDPMLLNDKDGSIMLQKLYEEINKFINNNKEETAFSKYAGESVKDYFKLKQTKKTEEYKLDVSEIINKIDNQIKDYNNKLSELDAKIETTKQNTLSETYGMIPSIYNFTKMLFAHLETLLYCIQKCSKIAYKATNRNINKDGHETDLKNNSDPFPELTVNDVEEWIGNHYPDFEEVKFVKSFLKAITQVESEIEQYETFDTISDIQLDNIENNIGSIWLPINAFDNSIDGIGNKKIKPYSNLISEASLDVNEIKSVLSTRIATICALTHTGDNTLLNSIIYGESINIIEELGMTPEHITIVITALNGILEDYKKKIDDYTLLVPYKSNNSTNNRFKYNLLSSGILPISDNTIKSLKKNITNGKVVNNIKYFFDGNKQIKTDQIKYPKTSISIINGSENCDYIYNSWLSPLKQKYSEQKNAFFMFSRYNNIESQDFTCFSNANYETQPLMNRVSYSSKEIIKGVNDEYYADFIDYCGLKNAIFLNNSDNIYKYYLGKDNIKSVEKSSINELNRNVIMSNNKPNGTNLAYPMIGGNIELIKNEQTITQPLYIFGHPFYYAQNNVQNKNNARKNKAFLFLQTLPININSFNRFIVNGKIDKSFMLRINKAELLLLGSILWRYKNGNTIIRGNVKDITIPDKNRIFRKGDLFVLSNDLNQNFNKCEIIDYIISSGMDYDTIIKFFEDWCIDKINEDGWLRIENNLELHKKDGTFFTDSEFSYFCKVLSINNTQSTINKYINKSNIDNYFIIKLFSGLKYGLENNYQVGLITKDDSNGVSTILSLLFNECILTYTGYGIINDGNNKKTDISYDNVRTIVNGLINKLKLQKNILTKIETKQTESTNTKIKPETNEYVLTQTYKYMKTLYDKWVSGYNEKDHLWINEITDKLSTQNGVVETFDFKNIKFIDRSYNNIGYKFIINYKDVYDNLININDQKTLYSIITELLVKNNFLFIPMPNYQKWSTAIDFVNIFKQIPYSKSKMVEDSIDNPVFLCLYTGEPSKKLNIKSNDYYYKDDTLNFNVEDEKKIPSDFISAKQTDNIKQQDKIPAFAVNYGKQNQQYFKNIRLNQNNPATTEYSILAIKSLLEKSDTNTKISTTSQDMYTLYSNYSYTCQMEMPGCVQIQPMMYFQLTNIPMWNGAYLIYKTVHTITPENMTTSFTGMKMSKNYPKLVLPLTIGVNNLNTNKISIAQETSKINTLPLSDKIGPVGYFKRSDYVSGQAIIPEYIITRIETNVAPIVDYLMDSWMASDVQIKNKYGKFVITNGYRNKNRNKQTEGASENSMHIEGLAVDIQLINKSKQGNEALFNHIYNKMKNGELKIDQLINERNKIICHIGVIKINGVNAQIRGQVMISESNGQYTTIDTVKNIQTYGSIRNKDEEKNIWLNYWMSAENSKNNPYGGWNNEENLWFSHDSAEGGDKTISYGIKLSVGYLQSLYLKSISLTDLQNGIVGITDKQAIDEIITQADNAYNDIRKYVNAIYGKDVFDSINNRYKYAMVDIYLNHGSGNFKKDRWKPFIYAATKNDLENMIINANRGSNRRTKLFVEYLRQ